MITNEQIKKTIADCAKSKYTVNVRDIAYALLSLQLEDSIVAYKAIFGNDYDFNQEYHTIYDNTASINYLKSYVEFTLLNDKKKKKNSEDISFEENKAYMLKLKKQTEEAMVSGDIDKKDGLKILTDISTKLNDKFSVKDETQQEQVIFVHAKYNDICPKCSTEISRRPISKEEAIELYNLVEKEE